jgi:Fe2+ transport system protein B
MCLRASGRSIFLTMAVQDDDGRTERFFDRVHRLMYTRVIGEPVWLYVLWIIVCLVLAIGTVYSILSGSVPCPDPTSGC